MEPQQPQQPFWADLAAVPEWLTIGRHPVPNGGLPAPMAGYQQFPMSSQVAMASNNHSSPQSPPGVMASQPGMVSRGDTQAVPPHPTPHHAAFPPHARAVAAAASTQRMPYGQQPTANRPPPPRGGPNVRNVFPMPVQRRQQQLARAPIVPSQAPAARAGVAPPPYHGQTHRAPQGHFAHATHMQPRPRAQPRYAPPPGPPPGWQGSAQTRYAPPPGPPPGWTATPPPPPGAPRAEMLRNQTQLPPSREQTASPWSAAGFTPSPVVSTAATTPRLALTPSPAVGEPAPLPILAQVARSATPQIPLSGQRVAHEHEQSAAPVQVARSTLKRRIADAGAGACEPGPSKRLATDASVQARSSETDTTGRQVQQYNIHLPSQRAPASPQRDAAPTPVGPEPVASSAESKKEDAPAVADDDAGSLFGDDDCIDEDDATLAMELALALGQDDGPAVASDDADPPCEDGDGISDAELARELALALGEPDDIPAVASAGAEDGDSIDDAELARELELALGEDDAACAAANDDADGTECAAPTAQLSLPLGLVEAGWKEGAGAAAAKATSAPLPGGAGGASASATTREPVAATFALCLPGTDPVPEGSVARSGLPAHLLPVALAPMATAPSGGSTGKGKKAVRATPLHASASSGASLSAPPREAAEPLAAPGKRGKGGARKKAPSAAHPSTAAGPSATAAAVTHAAAVEKSVKRSKAMATQNPDVFKSYSWMEGSSSASGSGPASTSFAAAAPVPARPLFTRSPPPPGPLPKGGRRNAVRGRRCPKSEPMPKDRPFWCKMCWEDRVKTTYWYDYDCLRRHVREKHPDLLDSDLWKHEGM